jgi:DNA-binding FadR family transcriptional regulator
MSFNSVTVVRPYEQIVNQIQQAIRDGQLPRGAKLPTERELAESFGVSRAVVREAVKVLDAIGLVTSRQGSGLYVRNEPIRSVTRAFFLSVSPDAESVERLFEFRQGLEMESARLAAGRRADADLEKMQEAIALVEHSADPVDWLLFGKADTQFHHAIAQASGNPYLQVAIATAREMQQDVVNLITDHPGSIRSAIGHHQLIMDAIVKGDAGEASAAMAAHIEYTASIVQSEFPETTPPAKGPVKARQDDS